MIIQKNLLLDFYKDSYLLDSMQKNFFLFQEDHNQIILKTS